MEMTSTAAALSTYGLYAIVAILMLAVMHLYKEHNRLVDEMRKNMQNDNKEISKLLAESNEVIKRNTKAMESLEAVSRQMSDTTRQLSEMVTQVRAIAETHK
jgi:seryl-tRNA synthetase